MPMPESSLAETARALEKAGRLNEAIGAYKAVFAKDPNDLDSSVALGKLCLAFGSVELGTRALQNALLADPERKDAGPLLVQMGVMTQQGWDMLRQDQLLRGVLRVLLLRNAAAVRSTGFHVVANLFYCPLNDPSFLQLNQDLRDPVATDGIDWELDSQLELLEKLSSYWPELDDVPAGPLDQGTEYCWVNGQLGEADARVLYGMVRHFRPSRYLEVGGGWSSLMLRRALEKNDQPCSVALVEPYPTERLFRYLPKSWRHEPHILQRAPLELFDQLGDGDVLFYDGSHCAKSCSDVNWFFFRVLPRLKRGVIIHLHDICLPHDYPEHWLAGARSWNEQYLLQAFLMHNPCYRILYACSYVAFHRRERLQTRMGQGREIHGGSFWMRKQ